MSSTICEWCKTEEIYDSSTQEPEDEGPSKSLCVACNLKVMQMDGDDGEDGVEILLRCTKFAQLFSTHYRFFYRFC